MPTRNISLTAEQDAFIELDVDRDRSGAPRAHGSKHTP